MRIRIGVDRYSSITVMLYNRIGELNIFNEYKSEIVSNGVDIYCRKEVFLEYLKFLQ